MGQFTGNMAVGKGCYDMDLISVSTFLHVCVKKMEKNFVGFGKGVTFATANRKCRIRVPVLQNNLVR